MPEIRTARLRLRDMTLDDVDAYRAYRTDPDVCASLTTATPPTREHTIASIEHMLRLGGPTVGEDYRYLIEADGALVGDVSIGIRAGGGVAEIGYVLHPDHRGHGYATDAAAAVVDHVIEHHGIHRIEASLAPDNVPSMRVLESIGMTFEVLARLAFDFDGVWEDDLRYAMTADERRAWRDRERGAPELVELVEITPDDAYLWGRLQTHYSEQRFVATMPVTWRDALFPEVFEDVAGVPWMRGVTADGDRAAFVMTSATHGTRDGHYLWRLLVDRMHQRRGVGRRAIELLVDRLRRDGVPRLYTSCGQGSGTPQPFYERLGFVPTGALLDDEIELVLEL
jgi:RimJ/RimL family protein N-acetyltransferase